MKKNRKFTVILTVCAVLALALPIIAAAANVSPALDVIAAGQTMTKSVLTGSDVSFTAADFDKAVGKRVNTVTIVSLPDVTSGKLYLGSLEVQKNQTLRRSDLQRLRFVQTSSLPGDTSFTYRCGNDEYALTCSVYTLGSVNYAPVVSTVSENVRNISTYKNITVYGTMTAVDPENDALTYSITRKPSKGLLTVTDRMTGSYSYTPVADFTGKDSFEYTVTDKYGNVSDPVRISIRVEKPATNVVFDDMIGHWAHNAAIRLYADGIMVGECTGNRYVFNPDETVSRSDFLVMAMLANDITINTVPETTVFLDDEEIPSSYKGYVTAAVDLGIVKGIPSGSGVKFDPNGTITRAEAAVILNNMLDLAQPAVKTVYSDSDEIPVWAETAFSALSNAGIFKGSGDGFISPSDVITRAQAAQLLCAVMDNK